MTKPMLAPKPLNEFTPTEFQEFVRSMKIVKVKAEPVAVTFRLNKKGTPILTIRRKPRYILRNEIDALAAKHKFDVAALFILAKSKCPIYASKEEAERIENDIKEIPW